MKKAFPVLLVLLLALSSSALAVRVGGDDLPSGWYSVTSSDGSFSASSVYLPEGCSLELGAGVAIEPLQDKESVRPFTVGMGQWKCPENIPTGVYSISSVDDKKSPIVTIIDEKGHRLFNEFVGEDRKICNIQIKDGYSIRIESYSARFESPIGIVFD